MTAEMKRWVRRWVVTGGIGLLVVAAALFGGPALLDAVGRPVGDPQPTPFASPTAVAPPDAGVIGVAAGVNVAAHADGAVLAQRISAIKADGVGKTAWLVSSPDGRTLAESGAASLMTPASSLKTVTGLLALDAMPADRRFSTTVMQPTPGSIVIVGGGDPFLTTQSVTNGYPRPASLADLADRTAAALKEANQTSVTLGYDEKLFTGPGWQPTWEAVFETDVTRVSALMADVGVLDAEGTVRTKTPALHAATSFAALLTQRGITVSGAPSPASGAGTELAKVESMPLHVLIQQALLNSDNTATEVILRHVAIASGREASFDGGTAAAKERLERLGIWQDGAILVDGSGVSRENKVSPAMLSAVIRLMLTDQKYQVMLDAIPVAGATGTLRDRFLSQQSATGRGWVRAKTGSLRDTSALAGFARSADGENLILVFMSNSFANSRNAKTWIDDASATVAGCGCR